MAKSASDPEKRGSASDISTIEEETLNRVNKTMRSIEGFLARWNASKVKAGEMIPEVAKIKEFHKALTEWQRKALANRGKGSREDRMKRLEDFVLICRSYS